MNRVLALILTGLGLLVAGYLAGVHVEHNANEAAKAHAQATSIEMHNAAASVAQTIERATVQRSSRTEAVFNGLQEGVIRYAQGHPANSDCRLDDDGLRLWSDANDGADLDASRERNAAMPGVATPEKRSNDGPAGESRRGGQGVPPVPGSSSGVDQLAGDDQ